MFGLSTIIRMNDEAAKKALQKMKEGDERARKAFLHGENGKKQLSRKLVIVINLPEE